MSVGQYLLIKIISSKFKLQFYFKHIVEAAIVEIGLLSILGILLNFELEPHSSYRSFTVSI